MFSVVNNNVHVHAHDELFLIEIIDAADGAHL